MIPKLPSIVIMPLHYVGTYDSRHTYDPPSKASQLNRYIIITTVVHPSLKVLTNRNYWSSTIIEQMSGRRDRTIILLLYRNKVK